VAEAFVAAQHWLTAAGERAVVVPFARELAGLVPVHEVRMRRDFTQLLTLIRAHALLHSGSGSGDDHGRIVATLDDYAVVYDIVQPVFAASLSAGLTHECAPPWRPSPNCTTENYRHRDGDCAAVEPQPVRDVAPYPGRPRRPAGW